MRDEWVNEWNDEWKDEWVNEWKDELKDEWMDDEWWKDEWMNEWKAISWFDCMMLYIIQTGEDYYLNTNQR